MTRIVAHLPDLLFGSKVQGMLVAAGYDVLVVGSPQAALAALAAGDVLVADLCEDSEARIGVLGQVPTQAKKLAFYLHTDVETRSRALAAGFDLVVPRSRMAREGAALVGGLVAA